MLKKKEYLLALGIVCWIIAFLFYTFGISNIIRDIVLFLFLGLALFSCAVYLVMATFVKKKK
jgi:hypothetical protein